MLKLRFHFIYEDHSVSCFSFVNNMTLFDARWLKMFRKTSYLARLASVE